MVINKKVNNIYIYFFFYRLPFVIKIGWNDFCWSTLCCFAARLSCCVYNLIIRKQWIVNNTSYIFTIFATSLAGFWIKNFWHTPCSFGFLHLYQYLWYSAFDLSCNFYHESYIDICIIYVLLMFSIHLFLLSH